MITKQQLDHQLKVATINTSLKLKVNKENGYYVLKTQNNEVLSKYGTKDEIYNILFTLNNINDFGKFYDHHKSDIYNIVEYHDLSVKCGVAEKFGSNYHVNLDGIAHTMINRKKELDEKALKDESTKTGIPLNKLRKIKDILTEWSTWTI